MKLSKKFIITWIVISLFHLAIVSIVMFFVIKSFSEGMNGRHYISEASRDLLTVLSAIFFLPGWLLYKLGARPNLSMRYIYLILFICNSALYGIIITYFIFKVSHIIKRFRKIKLETCEVK